MSFYTLCQKDGLQVLEPTCKYVDNQTLCLEENADRARSFSLETHVVFHIRRFFPTEGLSSDHRYGFSVLIR